MQITEIEIGSVDSHSRVPAAYKAAPTAANADGMAGLIEKPNNANIPTIPSEIAKAVRIEPIINFARFDLTGTFSTSLSIIILGILVLYWPLIVQREPTLPSLFSNSTGNTGMLARMQNILHLLINSRL